MVTSCATAVRGTSQSWAVDSVPRGARAELSNGMVCEKTPCAFAISRRSNFEVKISLDGYKTQTRTITSFAIRPNNISTLKNAVMTSNAFGFGIDRLSGTYNELTPNPLVVTLQKLD